MPTARTLGIVDFLILEEQRSERTFNPFLSTNGPDVCTGLGLSTGFGFMKSQQKIIRVRWVPEQWQNGVDRGREIPRFAML